MLLPLITAASLVPTIATVIAEGVPSLDNTLNVSVILSPTGILSLAELAVNFQVPFSSMEKTPFLPTVAVCAMNVFAPSTSETANVPLVVTATSVSANWNVLVPVITAASFVPVMLTVMDEGVPSAACTTNVSVALAPLANWSWAEVAV